MGAPNLGDLADRHTPKDDTPANASTIALLAQWGGRSCLLAGDAHPDVLLKGIDRLVGNDGVLDVDVFKLPHHGSKANVTKRLMARVRASVYVFSTSGRGNQRHPHDEAVARVILGSAAERSLAFNYSFDRTRKWDAPDIKGKRGYSTMYPSGQDGRLSIDLFELPRR